MKSMRLNQRELELIVLGLRFAMVQETEWKVSYAHMTDEPSKNLVKESDKLIRKFGKTKRKIQDFLQGRI